MTKIAQASREVYQGCNVDPLGYNFDSTSVLRAFRKELLVDGAQAFAFIGDFVATDSRERSPEMGAVATVTRLPEDKLTTLGLSLNSTKFQALLPRGTKAGNMPTKR